MTVHIMDTAEWQEELKRQIQSLHKFIDKQHDTIYELPLLSLKNRYTIAIELRHRYGPKKHKWLWTMID